MRSWIAIVVVAIIGSLAVLVHPSSVSAEAGPGGGGGTGGCAKYAFSTCVGAVWRYYKTTSNSYGIKNVGAGYTYATGCGSAGGFFAYVLVNRTDPHNASNVRSWKIGPVNSAGDRSIFFGGWTNYRVYSVSTDKAPTNPTNGEYSWYQAKAAFLQTKAQGQNSGYEWNGSSRLGWFCYSGRNFALTPTITASPSNIEGGGTVTLDPAMNNTGTTASGSVAWRVTQFTVAPGGKAPSGATNKVTPPVYFATGTSNVKTVAATSSSFAKGTTAGSNFPMSTAARDVKIDDLPVGTKVCFALSVAPYNQNVSTGDWKHSNPYCIVIAKRPKVQILGNDLFVGRGEVSNIITSTTVKRTTYEKTYGSWGEYAVIATGGISGMASGAGYNNGASTSGPKLTLCNLLTFTNQTANKCTATSTTTGSYTSNAASLPSISARLTVTKDSLGKSPAAFNIQDKAKGVYTATGDVTLSGNATIPAGRWVVLNMPDADVRIRDNIEYSNDTLRSASDIPQVIIIANSIAIDASVTRVDAWLIATGSDGTIDTCKEVSNFSDLNSDKCDKRLTVNGPVIAKHLLLKRTAGSGPGDETGDPAEKFNLRPDAYLWATAWIADAGRLQTTFSKELPPRF